MTQTARMCLPRSSKTNSWWVKWEIERKLSQQIEVPKELRFALNSNKKESPYRC